MRFSAAHPHRRRRRGIAFRIAHIVAVLLTLASASTVVGVATADASASTVPVWFLYGEQLASVARPGSTPADAVRALLAGPTPAQVQRGFRTEIPSGTSLESMTVAGGIATIDVSLDFVLGDSASSLDARLTELVHTAVGIDGVTSVRLLVAGGTPLGMFPGIVTTRPLTLAYLETPDVPAPPPAAATPVPRVADIATIQQRLVALGYLMAVDANGTDGPETETAVLAFQKWEGLATTGTLDAPTVARLKVATRPTPITTGGSGKRAEVLLDRQVALAIDDNKVVRVIPVSTGKASTPTPPGDFTVYAKYPKWWSTPFREWLLWALPFNKGIAFHFFPDVPNYAASHGCVREMVTTAKWLYDFAVVGMPVKVIARSR